MITIQHKRFLRKPLVISRNSWDECTQQELLLLFKILESRWYKTESRMLVADFLEQPTASEFFPIIGLRGLSGPAAKFRTMCMGQWAFIERAMFDISQNPSADNYCRLMACIYTNRDKPFTPEMVATNAPRFKKLPMYYFSATVRCWDALRKWGYAMYPYVFPKPSSMGLPATPQAPEYVRIMRRFANGNSDADVEKIFYSRAHNILAALDDELKPKPKKTS